jgi:DNA-binding transcriptional MerR regulator
VRIGELAGRTGVDPRLLRYYERQGLLHPAREANGYRDFDEADVAAVFWIRRLLGAGLSTATIAEFQACVRYQGPRRPRPASGCSTGSPRSGPDRRRHRRPGRLPGRPGRGHRRPRAPVGGQLTAPRG